MLQYADDTLLYRKGRCVKSITKDLGKEFKKFSSNLKELGIEVNKKKTKFHGAIRKGKREEKHREEFKEERLMINKTRIEAEEELKYLGIYINDVVDNKLSTAKAIKKGGAAYGQLKSL